MDIELQHISQSYGDKNIYNDFSLSIEGGNCVCILGPSGLGKTTLLKIIAGLIAPDKGDINDLANKVSYVFQEHRLLMWRSIYDNLKFVRQDVTEQSALYVLNEFGLGNVLNELPKSLSGGMLQRASIARAVISNKDIMLLDEPFKSLDALLKFDVIDKLIKRWDHNKQTVVIVTHDIDVALKTADCIICLDQTPVQIKAIFNLEQDKNKRNIQDTEHLGIKHKITQIYSKTC